MAPRRITGEIERDVVSRYTAGERVLDIAQRHGIANGSIYRILRTYGVDPNRHRRSRSAMTVTENSRLRAALRLALERLEPGDAEEVRRIADDRWLG